MVILKHDIIVVGGGAAGITAAITAKNLGKDMLLVSKLKLVANIFNEFFDEIHCIEDLELKLNS